MFCSLCLNSCHRYHDIPCGHHPCLTCATDYTNQQSYQCPICLQNYQLEIEPRKIPPPLPITSMLLYCIDCDQAFSFQQMKSGLHRMHAFDHLQTHLPSVRERALQKLNKGLMIENSILLSAQGQMDDEYLGKIKALNGEIKVYFSEVRQMLLRREQNMLSEVKQLEEKTIALLQQRRQQYLKLYAQIHRINQILQEFLQDRLSFDTFDILNLLRTKQAQFINRIKQIDKPTIIIPKFIGLSTLPTNLYSHCFLKYPEISLAGSESNPSEPQRTDAPKRVNLSSKVLRKMNWL